MSNTKVLTFNVLMEKHDAAYVAHCLETGIVATALDESDVFSKMSKLLEREVRFAIQHGRLGDIYHLAPKEVLASFDKMERVVSRMEKSLPIDSRHDLAMTETAYAATC